MVKSFRQTHILDRCVKTMLISMIKKESTFEPADLYLKNYGLLLPPPPVDGIVLHPGVTLSMKFARAHFAHPDGERPQAQLELGSLDLESSALIIRSSSFPIKINLINICCILSYYQ